MVEQVDRLARGRRVAYGYEGNYSTWLWGNRTVALVEAHARDEAARTRGLFVYLGFNAVHDSVSLPGPRAATGSSAR